MQHFLLCENAGLRSVVIRRTLFQRPATGQGQLGVRAGGAIYAAADSELAIYHSAFINLTAGHSLTGLTDNGHVGGGAIFMGPGRTTQAKATPKLRLRFTLFRNCDAGTVGPTGGAIHMERGYLDLFATAFVNNAVASDDQHVFGTSLVELKIKDTLFYPFSAAAVRVDVLGDCAIHPCVKGERCVYQQYSLSCAACAAGSVGLDGQQCSTCGAGTGPNQNQTSCVPCDAGKFSTFGVCRDCAPPQVTDKILCSSCQAGTGPNQNRTACQPCTGHDVSAKGICAPCELPKVADVTNRRQCVQCPGGRGPPNQSPNQTDCTACTGGNYSLNGDCTLCPSGQQPNHPEHTACIECAVGTTGKGGECNDCAAGYFALGKNDPCSPCESLTLPTRLDTLDAEKPVLTDATVCPGGTPGVSAGIW